mmetsp:Transcript_41275/g.109280  ORF Transcript_41275/g.109280 Transcript_41275/m.109280 type:complete len:105 (+) Transcript_41275:223-537(+)
MQSDANTSRYVDTSSDAQVWHRLKNMRCAEVEVDAGPQSCPENAKPKASNFQKKVERDTCWKAMIIRSPTSLRNQASEHGSACKDNATSSRRPPCQVRSPTQTS